jgi:hypothetical protein
LYPAQWPLRLFKSAALTGARMPRRLAPALAALSCAALCVALPRRAQAAVPEVGEATVTILAGWRGVPQHALMAELKNDGLNPTHPAFQPGFLLQLGFQPDDDLHITVDLGYGLDSWKIDGGDASVSIVNVLLSADTALLKGKGWSWYLGGGLGYSLNTFSRNGLATESNGSAGFLKTGLRLQLKGPVALVIEDRYTLASADYPELKSMVNVGGNTLSIGLMFHFLSPEDKGHPDTRR